MNTKGQSINTFKDGLVSDLNAITTPNTVLTDAKDVCEFYKIGRQQYCVVKGLGKIKLKYKMFKYE